MLIPPGAGLITFLLGLAAAYALYVTAHRQDRARFENAVRITYDRIESRLEVYVSLLRGVASLATTSPEAMRADAFDAYVTQLAHRQRYSGLVSIGLAYRVDNTAIADFEAHRQREGSADFRIWPAELRSDVVPITYLAPATEAQNRHALGFDLTSESTRRQALEWARDLGQPMLSGRLMFVPNSGPPGFHLYIPIYRSGGVPATVEDRRRLFIGVVVGRLNAKDLFVRLSGHEQIPQVVVRIYDGEAIDDEHLLYDSQPDHPGTSDRGYSETRRLTLWRRTWTVAFDALPGFETFAERYLVFAVLAASTAASLIVLLLLRRQMRARWEAEKIAGELRGSLAERQRTEEQLVAESRINAVLYRVGMSVTGERDLERVMALVTQDARALTGAELAAFFAGQDDRGTGAYCLMAQSGSDMAPCEAVDLVPGGPILGVCDDLRQIVRRDDFSPDQSAAQAVQDLRRRAKSVLAVPLVSRTHEVLGTIVLVHHEAGHFTDQHEQLVRGLAGPAAIALDNARLYQRMREADQRKDEFLAQLSHELRNPLAPLLITVELLEHTTDPAVVERHRHVMKRQLRHMKRLVDDLLEVSRITRGKITLRKTAVKLQTVVAAAVELARPLIESREHRLTLALPPEPLVVMADEVRLEQIFTNLLNNAAKYTPPGGTLGVTLRATKGQVEIEFRDTGIGLTAESLERLFEPFFQAPEQRAHTRGGLGLGLALVKGLVELHGGAVRATSAGPGQGAAFVVQLPGPLLADSAIAPALASPRGLARVASTAAPDSTAPACELPRILIVDDNVDAAETLAEVLLAQGYDVSAVHTGLEGIAAALRLQPGLILLDIDLPDLSGYDVVTRLRRLGPLQGTRIWAVTGFGQESDRERALAAGFDTHLVKPLEITPLLARLRELPLHRT